MLTSSRHNFDDEDTELGFYASVTKFFDRMYGRSREWWHRTHEDLGRSPCSALCDGEFEAVHALWLTR